MTNWARAGMRAGLQSVGVVLVTYAVVASGQSLTDRLAQTPPTLQPDRTPPKPAPIELPDNPDDCDRLRTRLTTTAVNQYNSVVRTCQSPECRKSALDTWSRAYDDAEQKYRACRARTPVAGTAQTPQRDPGAGGTLPQTPSTAGAQPLHGRVTEPGQAARGYPNPTPLQGGTSGQGATSGTTTNASGGPTKIGCVDLQWDDGKLSGVDHVQVTVPPGVKEVKGPPQSRDGRRPYWDYAEGHVLRTGLQPNDPDQFVFTALRHDGRPLTQVNDLRILIDPTGKSCKGTPPSATLRSR
jgi:hypothetical protein